MTNTDPGAPEYEFDWQNPNLKKFDFGRTFSKTIDILKLKGLKMLILSLALIGLPFFLISIWPMFLGGGLVDVFETNESDAIMDIFSGGMIIVICLGILVAFFASLWLQPALIKISYGALIGEDAPMFSTLKNVTKFVFPVLGFFIIYIVAVLLGLVLLVVPALFIGLGWMLGGHIIVLEGEGVMDSLSRSWQLTKGSKRWLFLLAIVFGVIGMIISVIISIPIFFIADPNVAMLEGASTFYWLLNGFLSAISQALATIIGVAWGTAAYVEIRRIKEGVNPESQIDVFN